MLWQEVDEVHISCTFTWDMDRAEELAKAWGQYYPVKLGGPAYGSDGGYNFVPGRFVKQGVTFTTRGCDNRCSWCLVPEREGRLYVMPDFPSGHIVNDNNLLQAPRWHIERVIAMLKTQRAAVFAGGIDARLVTDWFAEQLQSIHVNQLFLACDTENAIRPLRKAVDRLRHLPMNKRRCYVLIGRESIDKAEARLREVWEAGCMPFAQLYQPPERKRIEYSQEWKDLQRTWCRPAAMAALMGKA